MSLVTYRMFLHSPFAVAVHIKVALIGSNGWPTSKSLLLSFIFLTYTTIAKFGSVCCSTVLTHSQTYKMDYRRDMSLPLYLIRNSNAQA
jgi:hypothetical protein